MIWIVETLEVDTTDMTRAFFVSKCIKETWPTSQRY